MASMLLKTELYLEVQTTDVKSFDLCFGWKMSGYDFIKCQNCLWSMGQSLAKFLDGTEMNVKWESEVLGRQLKEAEVSPRLQMQSWKQLVLFQRRSLHLTHTRRPIPLLQTPFTYLAVPVTLILHWIGLVEFVLQLSDQIVLCVHDI